MRAALWLAAWLLAAPAWASPAFCGAGPERTAAEEDRLLKEAAILQRLLDAQDAPAALVARSGMNLKRVGLRYSHAALAVAGHPEGRWAVRQLYYDCEHGLPRLYDQGLAGFVLGTGDVALGHLHIVLLPGEAGAQAAAAALDTPRAKALLAARYSANAYAFSTRYQNCNQWVAELLAGAWGGAGDAQGQGTREQAQAWLQAEGYAPSALDVTSPLVQAVALFSPWLHADDHPPADITAGRIRVSTPEALAAFALARVPGAHAIELCHTATQVVVREGGAPLPADCTPAAGDRVEPL